jgi:hypothetical protein
VLKLCKVYGYKQGWNTFRTTDLYFSAVKKLFAILLLLPALAVFSQKQEPKVIQFSGYALTADSLMGVPFAHITILSQGRVATAGPDGYFSFAATEGDTLYFTSVGFKPSVYIIPSNLAINKYSVIQMMAKSEIYLRETIIFPWGDREGFRKAFVDLRLPDDDLERAKRNMEREMLAELGEKLEKDGQEATQNYMRNTSANTYYYRQAPNQNIFNPLAWAEFIRAWKNGDFKKK